jgi:predicted Zn-dependent protease
MESPEGHVVNAMEIAREGRAVAAEALCVRRVGKRLDLVAGRPMEREVPDRWEVRVRVWSASGGEAVVSGRPEDLSKVVTDAITQADGRAGSSGGPAERLVGQERASDVLDRRYSALTSEDRRDCLMMVSRSVSSVDKELMVSDVVYEDEIEDRAFANTVGVRLAERRTRFAVRATVSDPITSLSLGETLEARSFSTLASVPFAGGLGRRLVDLRGPSVTIDGPVRVLMCPWAVAQIVNLLAPHFAWAALEAGTSFLARVAPRGALTLSPLFHVIDDGLCPGGLNSRSFDDRGVTPVPLTLLREGTLGGWYVSVDEAREHGSRPTGHGQGDRLEPTNLMVRAGLRSSNALLAEQAEPVLVIDHFRGLDDGVDLASGSLRVRASGRLMGPRNQRVGVAPNVEIEGSLTDILTRIVDLTSDTDRYRGVDAAAMLVDGFVVRAS